MSGSAQPIGNNVVQFPPQQPAMVPNPAFAQWAQMAQQVQAIKAQNQQKQQQFDAAVALIKQDGLHGFRLDIEADSTIAADEQAEKQGRVEFLQQMVPLLENVVPIAQGNPPLAALAREIVLFAARGFRVARPLEEAMEQAFDAIAQMPPNPKVSGQQPQKGPAQNPQIEAAKVQADVHDTQIKAQTDQLAIAQKAQQAAQDAQVRMAQVAAENERSHADRVLKIADMEQRRQLEQARITHIAQQTTKGMV